MKAIFFYISIFFFFSCSNNEEEAYSFWYSGIEMSNITFNEESNRIMGLITKNNYEFPKITRPYFLQADSILRIEKHIDSLINLAKKDILTTDTKYLFNEISEFEKYLSHCSVNNSCRIIDFDWYKKTPLSNEILQLLSNELKYSALQILGEMFKQTAHEKLIFDSHKVVIKPKSRNIRRGDIFEAEILFASLDTATQINVVISGDTLLSEKGFVNYRVVPQKIGIQYIKGELFFTHPLTKDTVSYPIKTELKVLNR